MAGSKTGRIKSSTHAVDGEALKRFQLQQGWSNEELSTKARIHVKTINRARNGQRIELFAIKKIALSLGLEHTRLFLSEKPVKLIGDPQSDDYIEVPISYEKRKDVIITVIVPFAEFNQTNTKSFFIGNLKQVIHSSEKINIVAVKNDDASAAIVSGTVVRLEMSTQDILRLLAAKIDGTLDDIKITNISLSDYSWLNRMIARLSKVATPTDADDETWSDMLNYNMVQ